MMAMNEQEPGEIEALLPWHAAGTLNRRDMERVERALAEDRELAQRYELVREELGETIHLNETLGAPSARAMGNLMAAIDAEAPRRQRRSFSLGAWLTEFAGGFSTRTLAYAGSVAAVLVLLQAAVIVGVLTRGEGSTQLAGQEQTSASKGLTVLVRFVPAATSAEITKFLESYKATLAGGPDSGLYRVRVTDAQSKDDLAKVVARMQNDKAIVGFIVPE